MVDHTRAEIRENGAGMQVYLSSDFVVDSQFPFDGGEEVLVHPAPSGGLVLLPIDQLDEAYPVEIDAPPPGVDDSLFRAQLTTDADPDPEQATEPASAEVQDHATD